MNLISPKAAAELQLFSKKHSLRSLFLPSKSDLSCDYFLRIIAMNPIAPKVVAELKH
jgi:hypothetical protein